MSSVACLADLLIALVVLIDHRADAAQAAGGNGKEGGLHQLHVDA